MYQNSSNVEVPYKLFQLDQIEIITVFEGTFMNFFFRIFKLFFSALKFITDPLNVLVIGPHDSGKTTLINSLLMSVTGDWSDRAPYGCGRKHNVAPVVLYENPEHHRRCRTRSDNHHSGRHPRKHYHFDPTVSSQKGRIIIGMIDSESCDALHT